VHNILFKEVAIFEVLFCYLTQEDSPFHTLHR
jgi:hypothetical protein